MGLPRGQELLRIETPAARALKWNLDHARPLNVRGRLVHPEGRYALQYRIRSGAQIDARQQIDGLVAAVGREHASRGDLVQRGQAFHQRLGLRLGVTIEPGRGGVAGRAPWRLGWMPARPPPEAGRGRLS